MATSHDIEALRKITGLVDFLAEVTDASQRNPVRDILSDEAGTPDPLIWLEELPDDVRLRHSSRDDVLLRLRPPRLTPDPRLPAEVDGWVDSTEPRTAGGPEPTLLPLGPTDAEPDERTEPPNSVVRAFTAWLSSWRDWSREQTRVQRQRILYERLERAAKTLEQQDDEYEFVLGVGLVCWDAPDGERIYRHLVTEPVIPKLDRSTAEVTVSLVGGRRRFEDKELFGDQDGYRADRGRAARQAVIESEASPFDPGFVVSVQEWLGSGLEVPFETRDQRIEQGKPRPDVPVLSASPALMLRPRSRAMLAEAYKRIAAALRAPDAQVPVALAQLVVDTEPEQRNGWLREQGAASGDVLGVDPLFPLPTNDEQMRVIELLRTETGVVVQGPPGTGKTHTIANLVSALLARGQRVLVTSQKDQALKVLREKIPPELRRLCVLLAGGSKDAARELERGLDALSGAIASPDTAALPQQIETLSAERHNLRSRSAYLNNRIRELRDVEHIRHNAVVPGFSTNRYAGTLTEIVREVKRNASTFAWIPLVDPQLPDAPPLSIAEAWELLHLLRTDTPARRVRTQQQIPQRGDLPGTGELADRFALERQARETAHADTSDLTQRLATAGLDRLQELARLGNEACAVLYQLGYGEGCTSTPAREWVGRAVEDHFAGRQAGLWGHLLEVRNEAYRLQQQIQAQGVEFVVDMPPVEEMGLGAARGLLRAGRELLDHLARGKKLRRVLPKSATEKNAAHLLDIVRVDGRPPTTPPHLTAALEQLEARVAAAQLVRKWADTGVAVSTERLALTLAELADHDHLLASVHKVAGIHAQVAAQLGQVNLRMDLSTVTSFAAVLDAVPAALNYVQLERARTQVNELHATVRQWATAPNACPEIGLLVQAIGDRDIDAYRVGLEAVDIVRSERHAEQRRADLARRLQDIHPQLLALLERTANEPGWDTHLGDLPGAWAWSKAAQFVQRWHNADEERRLLAEFDEVEDQIKRVTEQLAAARAMHACVLRMSDTHAMALRSYREHINNVGAGTGRKTQEYRKAARAAMEKAKNAVPAWVVPLPNLLDNITPDRNSFDVVIVDEASQVGLEHLFLLWMAPRVIVVGDDKQCTPGSNRMGRLDPLWRSLLEHMGDLGPEIRTHFTPKSNLYGVLSARSGKDAVVRLREHFRCMPEIINWSSRQFYGDGDGGLIPLRERKADDLKPLEVVHIDDAYAEGRDARLRNPVEAKRIVAKLSECLADPRYKGKTFGIVVLASATAHVKLLEHEINAAIPPEEREARQIRVGTAPNFQGDERDVMFLSAVVTQAPRAQSRGWEQPYNVAASRAKDQMWLFTSVHPADYKPEDLRASLVNYMLDPPSVYGKSPDLESVSATQACQPFESLFEQRVFREIKQRGYHVVPQYKVGSRALDLVVVDDGGRVAVECDGHRWHTSPTQQISDARRDRELRRMGWHVLRIRESEFEFDPGRELAPLWQRLDQRNIHPHVTRPEGSSTWAPIDLPEDDSQGDEL